METVAPLLVTHEMTGVKSPGSWNSKASVMEEPGPAIVPGLLSDVDVWALALF